MKSKNTHHTKKYNFLYSMFRKKDTVTHRTKLAQINQDVENLTDALISQLEARNQLSKNLNELETATKQLNESARKFYKKTSPTCMSSIGRALCACPNSLFARLSSVTTAFKPTCGYTKGQNLNKKSKWC